MAEYDRPTIAPGESVRTTCEKLRANADNQLIGWIDTTDPATPSNGQKWLDSTDPARYVAKIRENGVTKLALEFHRLEENLEGSGHQFVGLIPERVSTGGIVTPSAAAAGTIQYDQTRGRLVYVTTTEQLDINASPQSGGFYRIPARLETAARTNPGVADTSTEYGGLLLSGTAIEFTAIGNEVIPSGYTGIATANQKIILEVDVLLDVARGAGESLDIVGTMFADGNQTAIGGNSAVIAAGGFNVGTGNAQYSRHRLEYTLAPGDFTTNPVAGQMLRSSVKLDNTKQVTSFIVIGASYRVSTTSAMVTL